MTTRLQSPANLPTRSTSANLLVSLYFDSEVPPVPDSIRKDIALYLGRTAPSLGFGSADLLLVSRQGPLIEWSMNSGLRDGAELVRVRKPTRYDIMVKYLVKPSSSVAKRIFEICPPPQDMEGTAEITVLLNNANNQVAAKLLDRSSLLVYRVAGILKQFFLNQLYNFPKWSEMGLWLDVSYITSSALTVREKLHGIIQLLTDWFSARGAVFLINEADHTLVPLIGAGCYDIEARRRFKALEGRRLFPCHSEAVEKRKTVVVCPNTVTKYYPADNQDFFRVKWAVVAPMIVSDRVPGLIQLDRSREFGYEEVEIISAVARQAALVVEHGLVKERAQRLENLLGIVNASKPTLYEDNTHTPPKGGNAAVAALGTFTRREIEVLLLLVKGLTNKEISKELRISPETVKAHVSHIYRKLGASSRSQVILKALELGIEKLGHIVMTPNGPIVSGKAQGERV